tara:strand:- start:13576 stop:13929 length:354 start_codon:yes stop_codon:yes gene_type:complete
MSRGVGDSLEKIFKKTGVDKLAKKVLGDDCGCEERKKTLNKMFPYKKVRQFTPDEMEMYRKIIPSIERGSLAKGEQTTLVKLYNKVFNANKTISSCASCVKQTISYLAKVYVNSCKL